MHQADYAAHANNKFERSKITNHLDSVWVKEQSLLQKHSAG